MNTTTAKFFDSKNTKLTLDKSFTQGGKGAVVRNGSAVQYAVPNSDRSLCILTADLSKYHTSNNINDLNYWHVTVISSAYPANMATTFKVKTGTSVSIVAAGPYNYVFWRNDADEYWALRCRPDMSEKAISRLNLAGVTYKGAAMRAYYSNITAFVLPAFALPVEAEDDIDTIGCLVLANASGDSYDGHYQFILRPRDFGINASWKARRNTNWPRLVYPHASSAQTLANYTQLTCGVYNQGILNTTGNDADTKPRTYLIFNSTNVNGSFNFTMSVALTELFSPGTDEALLNASAAVGGLYDETRSDAAGHRGVSFCTSPSGMLYAYYRDGNSKLRSAYLKITQNTNFPNIPTAVLWKFELFTEDPDGVSPAITNNEYTPCAFFIPLKITTGQSPCPVKKPTNGSGDNGSMVYEGTLNQNYVQCMLGNDSSKNPKLSTFFWGTLFTIPEYVVADINDAYKKTLILSMVCDTFPYPIPAQTIWPSGSPSGMVNWGVCTYEYLVGKEQSETLTTEITSGTGFKGSNSFNVVGIGMASESAYSTGFTTLDSKSNTQSHTTGTSVETKFLANEESMVISPNGALFGSPPPGKLVTSVSLVCLRNKTGIEDILSTEIRPFVDLTSAAPPMGGNYQAYCYTPGKLATYGADQINAKMQHLFNSLGSAQQDEFIVFGEDFRSYYTCGQYLDKIVERFGVPCFGPEKNLPFLEFSFSQHGIERNELQSTQEFVHAGGAFIDRNSYVGFGWNIELGLSLGNGIAISFPLLSASGYSVSGAEYSSRIMTTQSETRTWGVRLGEYLNPLDVDEAYSVRMYLLKPHPLWARELKCFGHVAAGSYSLDYTYSSPVRILFTVPYISEKLRQRLG